jgi:hypothetical protein
MESTPGCTFVDGSIVGGGEPWIDSCAGDKQHAIDVINELKPDVVIISNSYTSKHEVGSDSELSASDWHDAMRAFAQRFSGSTSKIVFMSPPPMDKKISDCYGVRSRTPADCISKVTRQWRSMAQAEQQLATSIGGTWIDSQPWFCGTGDLCPSFVGNTLTKTDEVHMTPTYGQRITPVIAESLEGSWGVLKASRRALIVQGTSFSTDVDSMIASRVDPCLTSSGTIGRSEREPGIEISQFARNVLQFVQFDDPGVP